MRNRPEVLVFDAYGTIFDVHSVTGALERLYPGKGAALSQAWRTRQLEYTWLRSLMHRHADFSQVTAESLRVTCAAHGVECTEAALQALLRTYRELAPFPDALTALGALRGRLPLAILSNGAPEMLDAVVRHSALDAAFDAVLSVEAAGVFKPDPSVYQLAVDRFGTARDAIGFVSSNGWDAAGAKHFGFQVFWINRTSLPVEELGAAPDHVLRSLDELVELVD